MSFEDTKWSAATVIGNYGMSPWGKVPQIDSSAKWIWTSGYRGQDKKVYCRWQPESFEGKSGMPLGSLFQTN